jgi:hypothetical protein
VPLRWPAPVTRARPRRLGQAMLPTKPSGGTAALRRPLHRSVSRLLRGAGDLCTRRKSWRSMSPTTSAAAAGSWSRTRTNLALCASGKGKHRTRLCPRFVPLPPNSVLYLLFCNFTLCYAILGCTPPPLLALCFSVEMDCVYFSIV